MIGSNPFPGNGDDLAPYIAKLDERDKQRISTTLTQAGKEYSATHCTQNEDGTFNRNDGSPEFSDFVKPRLQALLEEASQETTTGSAAAPSKSENEGEVSQAPAQISAPAAAKIKNLIDRINRNDFPVNLREFLDGDFSDIEKDQICGIISGVVTDEDKAARDWTAAQKDKVISGLERLLPKKPGAWERMKQHNKGVEEFNKNIDTLVKEIMNPKEGETSILNMEDRDLLDSLSNFGQGSARLQVSETICQYRGEGAGKVAEKLLGLKRENKWIIESSNKKVAKWFVKPIVDTEVLGEPEFGLKGDGFKAKTKDLFKLGAFRNISEIAKKPITENGFSKKVEKYIQDESHALKWRTLAAFGALLGTGINAFVTTTIRACVVALAALTQVALWAVAGIAAVAFAVGVVALTLFIFSNPITGVPAGIYLWDRFVLKPRFAAMEYKNDARQKELLAEIEKLKNPGRVVEVADDASVHRNSVDSNVSSASETESIHSVVADNASVGTNSVDLNSGDGIVGFDN
ncbi:MAG: hypothetical protein FJZ62_06395 [Chlamydiae bacterium]|nr:hypothetical protein [Chlamydiota bacterium]